MVGPGGRTLTAVQDLARVAAQRRLGDHDTRLRIDVGGYREKRREALAQFAASVATQVIESGTAKALEPMSSADRKIGARCDRRHRRRRRVVRRATTRLVGWSSRRPRFGHEFELCSKRCARRSVSAFSGGERSNRRSSIRSVLSRRSMISPPRPACSISAAGVGFLVWWSPTPARTWTWCCSIAVRSAPTSSQRAVIGLRQPRTTVMCADVAELIRAVDSGSATRFDVVMARRFGPPEFTLRAAASVLAPQGRIVISDPPEGDRWPSDLLAELGLCGRRRGSVRVFRHLTAGT